MSKIFLTILLLSMAAGLIQSAPTIENDLLLTLRTKGSVNILLTLTHGDTSTVLRSIKGRSFSSRTERLTTLTQILKEAADIGQADIRRFINEHKSSSAILKTFWITNKLIVRNADLQLVQKLLTRPDLAEISEEKYFPLDPISLISISTSAAGPKADEVQPGVSTIRAPEVWVNGNTGEGAVIANVDTGVRVTHEALAGNHRLDYGWYDPEGQTVEPNDQNGHGTHTMGTVVGQTLGIGVAPGAQWIACKGCGSASCSQLALLTCGEWLLCPTDPQGNNEDCSKAPNVVSNSWGGGSGDDWYDGVLQALREGGIISVFSIGGSGPSCGSVGSPGDSKFALAVGSTDASDTVSSFSGHGPTSDGRVKPEVAAPGVNVKSAYNSGDDSYMVMSGTSFSGSYTAGLIALLVSENANLTVDEIQSAVEKGAVPTVPTGQTCGGIEDSQYPNNHVGHGRIDAVNSVALVSTTGGKIAVQ